MLKIARWQRRVQRSGIWGICPWWCKTEEVYGTLINILFMKNSCTHLWYYRVLMTTICILYFMNRSQFNCNEMRAKLEPVRPRYLHLVNLEVDDKNQLYYRLSNRCIKIWINHLKCKYSYNMYCILRPAKYNFFFKQTYYQDF